MDSAWRPDSALFYAATDDGNESIYEHRIGADAAAEQVFGGHERYWCSVSVSECGRYAVLYQWDVVHANNVYLLRLADDELVPVATTMRLVNQVQVIDDEILIVTDLDAPRGRLCKALLSSPTEWHTIIAESNDTLHRQWDRWPVGRGPLPRRVAPDHSARCGRRQDPRGGNSRARVGQQERGCRGRQRRRRQLVRRRGVGPVDLDELCFYDWALSENPM